MPLFGEYLRYHRTEQGLSLRRLAEIVSIDPSVLSRVERGEVASPSDELLDRLPQAIGRPRTEVYLAAGRITPDLVFVLEKGMPVLPEQTAKMLDMLTDQLHPELAELGDRTLQDLMTPTDSATMALVQSAMVTVAEIVQAMDQGQVTRQQFKHVVDLLHRLKLSLIDKQNDAQTSE